MQRTHFQEWGWSRSLHGPLVWSTSAKEGRDNLGTWIELYYRRLNGRLVDSFVFACRYRIFRFLFSNLQVYLLLGLLFFIPCSLLSSMLSMVVDGSAWYQVRTSSKIRHGATLTIVSALLASVTVTWSLDHSNGWWMSAAPAALMSPQWDRDYDTEGRLHCLLQSGWQRWSFFIMQVSRKSQHFSNHESLKGYFQNLRLTRWCSLQQALVFHIHDLESTPCSCVRRIWLYADHWKSLSLRKDCCFFLGNTGFKGCVWQFIFEDTGSDVFTSKLKWKRLNFMMQLQMRTLGWKVVFIASITFTAIRWLVVLFLPACCLMCLTRFTSHSVTRCAQLIAFVYCIYTFPSWGAGATPQGCSDAKAIARRPIWRALVSTSKNPAEARTLVPNTF